MGMYLCSVKDLEVVLRSIHRAYWSRLCSSFLEQQEIEKLRRKMHPNHPNESTTTFRNLHGFFILWLNWKLTLHYMLTADVRSLICPMELVYMETIVPSRIMISFETLLNRVRPWQKIRTTRILSHLLWPFPMHFDQLKCSTQIHSTRQKMGTRLAYKEEDPRLR